MNQPISDFFTNDHERIDALLDKATRDVQQIDESYYHRFRTGLLRHIKMEEKILFPAAQKANDGKALPLAAKLRLDHGALTALMVVPPTPDVVKVLRFVLEIHDKIEEEKGGMYEACEKLTADQTDEILERLDATTEVPVHPHNKAEYALGAAKRALTRAGFDYDQIVG